LKFRNPTTSDSHPELWFSDRRYLSYDERMPRRMRALLLLFISILFANAKSTQTASGPLQNPNKSGPKLTLRGKRSSPLDLGVTGSIVGLPPGVKRYLTHEDLFALPLVSLTVTDDPNFREPVNVKGVALDLLARELAADGEKTVIVAICTDWYRSYYPQAYREMHKPVLVLEIDGQLPSAWPKNNEAPALSMGPYLVTQPRFTPAFQILAHDDEPQIPWGVVRLEFRSDKTAFADIAPLGPAKDDSAVEAGYRISQQNCLRCHGPASDEPLKGKLTWAGIAMFAAQAPENFAAYVRNPRAQAKGAQMPANLNYDEATMNALISYFRTFAPLQRH
jgi:mono/diheme cytochrome c family protein